MVVSHSRLNQIYALAQTSATTPRRPFRSVRYPLFSLHGQDYDIRIFMAQFCPHVSLRYKPTILPTHKVVKVPSATQRSTNQAGCRQTGRELAILPGPTCAAHHLKCITSSARTDPERSLSSSPDWIVVSLQSVAEPGAGNYSRSTVV
jgi:hypothetical protein